MKIRNRIMSWVLSPGAYAVWHSMGNPGEWVIGSDDLTHKTGLRVTVLNWRNAHEQGFPRPIAAFVAFIIGAFIMDCEGEYAGAIGYLERHIIAGRAYRLVKKLRRGRRGSSARQKKNTAVFTKLTVNQEVE